MPTEAVDPLLFDCWIEAELASLDQQIRADIYRLVDHRIAKGVWRAEDRDKHFRKLLATSDRIMHERYG